MKQTTGAQGAWAGKEETKAHLTQKELDYPGARITQRLGARHDRREAGRTQAHPGDTQIYKNSVGAQVGLLRGCDTAVRRSCANRKRECCCRPSAEPLSEELQVV